MPSWKRTFYAAWVAQVCSIAGFSFVFPFMTLFIRDLGVPEGEVCGWAGLVSASSALSMAVFAPLWGILADRYGRKPMVIRSMFGGAAVLLLMSYAQSVGHLIACRLLQGALTGTITASVALVASVAPRDRSGYALGMMQAAVFVGMSVGPFFGGEVAQALGMRATFRVAAVLLLGGAVLVKFLVSEHFTPSPPNRLGRRAAVAEVLGAAGFLAAVGALFAVRFGNSVAAPVFPLFVEQVTGTRAGIYSLTGKIVALGGLSAAVSAWFLGRVSDAWGHRRLLILSCTVAGGVSIGYIFASHVSHLCILRTAFGLAAAGMIPAANAIIRRTTHDRNLGKAYGVTSSVTAIGWATGPLTGGFLHDYVARVYGESAAVRAPFLLMGLVLLAAAVLVVLWVRDDGDSTAIADKPHPLCEADGNGV